MRWQYENVENPKDTGELHTCTKPCKGDRLDFFDGREWLVERVTLRSLPMPITITDWIVGVLQLRPMPDMILHPEADSKILETSHPQITTGSILYNNRRRKIYEAFGKVAPCESDTWEILYRDRDWVVDRDWGSGEFRRRPASEFFELNRDGLPRFVLIPDRYTTDSEVAQWVEGYQTGLEFLAISDLPDDAMLSKLRNPQYIAFTSGYLIGRMHFNSKDWRESKTDASAQAQASYPSQL